MRTITSLNTLSGIILLLHALLPFLVAVAGLPVELEQSTAHEPIPNGVGASSFLTSRHQPHNNDPDIKARNVESAKRMLVKKDQDESNPAGRSGDPDKKKPGTSFDKAPERALCLICERDADLGENEKALKEVPEIVKDIFAYTLPQQTAKQRENNGQVTAKAKEDEKKAMLKAAEEASGTVFVYGINGADLTKGRPLNELWYDVESALWANRKIRQVIMVTPQNLQIMTRIVNHYEREGPYDLEAQERQPNSMSPYQVVHYMQYYVLNRVPGQVRKIIHFG